MPTDKSTIPAEGARLPAFTLTSHSGEKVSTRSLKGTAFVLYFYPKDMTPGCTTEAQGFRDAGPALKKLGVEVFGVSPDDEKSHCKFIEKHDLTFTLLSDSEHTVADKFGLWVEKNMYGRKYWGVQRATFLVGPDGKVVKAWPKVSPKGHAEAVLEAAKELL